MTQRGPSPNRFAASHRFTLGGELNFAFAMFNTRQCRNEDFCDVMQLLGQLWPDKQLDRSLLQKAFDRGVRSDSQVYLCATHGQRIVGFGSLTLKNNLWQEGYLGHIDELVVDCEYRGRGVGTLLLNELVAIATERECRRVELDSAFHRKQAHQFYERHGFENRAFLFSRVL